VARVFHAACHPRLWVHVVEQRGCICDDALIGCLSVGRPTEGRTFVGVDFAGRHCERVGDMAREFGDGDILVTEGRGRVSTREDSIAEPSLSFSVEWDREFFGSQRVPGVAFGQCSSSTALRAIVERLRCAIERSWLDHAAVPELREAVAATLDALRAEGVGVPIASAADLAHELPPPVEHLSRALDASLGLSNTRPTAVDLESRLLRTARTLRRHLPGVFDAWGQQPELFRELRVRMRLFQGALIMSHPGASVRDAAPVLGFATPSSFCRTFLERGLPSPGRIRERLHALE
jgi:AraC-like DNA-binding protein